MKTKTYVTQGVAAAAVLVLATAGGEPQREDGGGVAMVFHHSHAETTAAGRFAGSAFVEPLTVHQGLGPNADLIGKDMEPALAGNGVDPSPAPNLYEHSQMRDDLAFMAALAPQRQRVAVRAVSYRGLPVLYPPYHWLGDGIRGKTIEETAAAGGRDLLVMLAESGAAFLGEDHSIWDSIMLFGLLNVRVYPAPGESARCCSPYAELAVELTVDGEDVRRVRMAMHEVEQGVYYVTDPVHIAGLIPSVVISLEDRPLMTVVELSGVDYAPINYLEPVAYAVRWGGFVLEHGSHYVSDQKGVIR